MTSYGRIRLTTRPLDTSIILLNPRPSNCGPPDDAIDCCWRHGNSSTCDLHYEQYVRYFNVPVTVDQVKGCRT